MFGAALFNNLEGHRNQRLNEFAMMIGPGALCFLLFGFFGHGQNAITKG
jgi:hypothetical protein